MLPDPVNRSSSSSCLSATTSTSATTSHTSIFNDNDDRPEQPKPQQCPTPDFSTHFVIKSGTSSSENITQVTPPPPTLSENVIPTITVSSCPDAPPPPPTQSSEDSGYLTPSLSQSGIEIPRPLTAPSCSVPILEPCSSSYASQFGPQNGRPSTQPVVSPYPTRRSHSLQHPFMKSPGGSSVNRMFESTPSRTALLSFPDSPMDFSYQPISSFCLRKTKMGDYEMEDECCPKVNGDPDYDAILKACGQRAPIPIEMIFNGVKDIEKIGEGVYGEVYSASFRYFSQCSWVYKVVAIAGDMMVNGEKQKGFLEVLPEVVVSQELSKLKGVLNKCYTDGYAFMKNARIAVGQYPSSLLQPWDKFNDKYESDNDKPDFGSEQLYMVLEFEFAGQDIESLNFRDARQTLSIVLQVAHILAVGEFALEFEHRDLHWGNILVQNWQSPTVRYLLNNDTIHVPSMGIKAAVIDFTISRVKHSKTEIPVYLDLQDDEEQFLGTGDHQFDIYRMMRDHNRNNWQAFSPKSNIYWLHYLANKLYVKGQYTTASPTSSTLSPTSTRKSAHHFRAVRKLRELSYSILEHDSATDFVTSAECKAYREFLGTPSPTPTPTLGDPKK